MHTLTHTPTDAPPSLPVKLACCLVWCVDALELLYTNLTTSQYQVQHLIRQQTLLSNRPAAYWNF